MELVLIKVLVALAPVLVLLVLFVTLDAFKLMSLGEVAFLLVAGGALAAASYFANWKAMDELPIGFTNYSKWAAPVVEETLKALLMMALFARNRIGFMIDAAITGFAVGAGFSLVENAFYLWSFSGENLGVWLVRGFGTAVMHGGTAALFGALGQFLTERSLKLEAARYRFNPLLYMPGLLVAIAVHSAFNHFPQQPLAAMVVTLVAIPATLMLIFTRSAHSAHTWLLTDYETHEQMLAEIRSGQFRESEAGRFVLALSESFDEETVAAAFDYIQVHTELVVRAEQVLIANRSGEVVRLGLEVHQQFDTLHALERRIGRTALLAIRPHLRFSRNDLWEMNELEQDARAERRRKDSD